MDSSYIQVPYGYRKVSKPIQFRTPKNNFENKLVDSLGFISNKNDPAVKNNLLNAVKNREDLQKYILATSDLGEELQKDINIITGSDEKFNNAVVRRALDLKNNDLFRNPQPISLHFNNVEKFHQQNPIIGKLATQINAIKKLSDEDLTKRQFLEGDINRIEDRLYRLKYEKPDKKSESDFLELDTWVNFYFKQGRFPGNNDLTILPQTDLPPVVDQLSVEISPVDLYKKFGQGDTKCLTSFQAIVALFLNYGGDLNIAKKAMEEWKNNLTFQALSKENDKVFMNFSFLGEVVFYFLQKFLLIEQEFLDFEKNQFEIANETIKNSEITTITSPKKFQSKVLINDSNSLNEQESLFLKTSLTLSKTNLDASIEAAEEKNKKVIQEIIDPSPGFVIDEKFTDDDFSNREYGDKSKFKLNNAARQKFNNILKEINRDTKSFILPNRKYKLINESEDFTVEKEDFTVEKEESELEIQKSPLETKMLNKKDQKRSPYNLRSFKRKIEHLKSEDKLNKPLIFEVEDKEIDKINAAEKILNSIINKAPDTATK